MPHQGNYTQQKSRTRCSIAIRPYCPASTLTGFPIIRHLFRESNGCVSITGNEPLRPTPIIRKFAPRIENRTSRYHQTRLWVFCKYDSFKWESIRPTRWDYIANQLGSLSKPGSWIPKHGFHQRGR